MPYIKQQDRQFFNWKNGSVTPSNPGELNYLISDICKAYLELTGTEYRTFNDIIGALESAKQEFYRRVIVPYENEKCETHGDVY